MVFKTSRMKKQNCIKGKNKVNQLNCLATCRPDLLKEWHPTKNYPITPIDIAFKSNKKVWWVCSSNSEHVWETRVYLRTSGSGCPYCSGHRVSDRNRLSIRCPEILSEWHPTKNSGINPDELSIGSEFRVSWVCRFGHEWIAPVYGRVSGEGCPYCTGRKVCLANCLSTTHPELATQWYSTKNGTLTASDITAGSNKKA